MLTFFVKSKQFKVHCTLRQKEARTGPMWNGPQTPPHTKRLKNKAQPESEADQNSEQLQKEQLPGKRGLSRRGWWCFKAVLGGAASAVAARNG